MDDLLESYMGIRDTDLGECKKRIFRAYVHCRILFCLVSNPLFVNPLNLALLSPATTMVELGRDKKNPDEFAMVLDETLGDFAFPDEFVFDVWGAIGDAKQGRF